MACWVIGDNRGNMGYYLPDSPRRGFTPVKNKQRIDYPAVVVRVLPKGY